MAFGQVNKIVNYTWRFTDADRMTQTMMAVKAAALAASAAVVGGLVAMTKSSVELASAFAEMENQFNVVFGESSPEVRAELDAFAERIGRSSNQMIGFAASIQDTFVPLGLARDQAAELSVAATQLAFDLSSFKNLDTAQTVDRITSALAGQHRAVQQLGIVINQEVLSQELMNMGIEGGVQAATEAEKAMARYNIMVSASSDAIGDAERTSGEWANQVRSLEDLWYDLRLEIGQQVIPILEGLMPTIRDILTNFGEMAKDAIPALIEVMTLLVPVIEGAIFVFSAFIQTLGKAAEGINLMTRDATASIDALAETMNARNFENVMRAFSVPEFRSDYMDAQEGVLGLQDAFWGLFDAAETTGEELEEGGGLSKSIRDAKDETVKWVKELMDAKMVLSDIKSFVTADEQAALDALEKRQIIVQEMGRSQLEMTQRNNELMYEGVTNAMKKLLDGGLEFSDVLMIAINALGNAQFGGKGGVGLPGIFGFLGGLI